MKNKLLSFIFPVVLIASIAMTIGILNVYYQKKQETNSDVKVIVEEVQLLVNYNSGGKIVITDFNKLIDYNYDFSVTNESNEYKVNYKILFKTENYSFVQLNSGFKYDLSAKQKQISNTDKLISNAGIVPNSEIILGSGTIGPKQIHYYTLNLKYSDKSLSSGAYIGKIEIVRSIE